MAQVKTGSWKLMEAVRIVAGIFVMRYEFATVVNFTRDLMSYYLSHLDVTCHKLFSNTNIKSVHSGRQQNTLRSRVEHSAAFSEKQELPMQMRIATNTPQSA